MAKPNLSLTTYQLLDLFPIFAFLFVLFTFMVSYIVGIVCCLSCGHFKTIVSSYKLLLKGYTKLTMVVYGPPAGVLHYKRQEDEEVDDMDNTVVYIHKREVPRKVVVMLGAYVVCFIVFSMSVFWDIFLLNESSECDDTTIDCFAQVAGNDSSFSPVYDCNIYEGYGSNVTISCYAFGFSFGPALAAIGGLFTMIKLVMKAISAVFLGLYGYAFNNEKYFLIIFMIFFQILLVLFVPIVLPTVLIVFLVDLPSLSYANIVQAMLLMFTLIIGFSIPWPIFVNPSDATSGTDENESDRHLINQTDENYGTTQQNKEE